MVDFQGGAWNNIVCLAEEPRDCVVVKRIQTALARATAKAFIENNILVEFYR
jgi:hypothetical protein